MDKNEIISKLTVLAKDIFDNEDVVLTETTKARDVDGWDSLTHIQFVVAIEKDFKVKFTAKEIQSWQSVGDVVALLLVKMNP
jgi:acyl carrier protein